MLPSKDDQARSDSSSREAAYASERVADRLIRTPQAFEFVQAVRLLRRFRRIKSGKFPVANGTEKRNLRSEGAADVAVRFAAWPSLAFPAVEVVRLEGAESVLADEPEAATPTMRVAFHSLIGSAGALPRHYSQLVLDRIKLKDVALRDFLDLFHDRLLSNLYDAWAKYRLPVLFEEHQLDRRKADIDPVTLLLYSLVGMATPGLRGRLPYHDHALLYYAGHFSHQPRNGIALECMVADFFSVATQVLQLHGQWLYLDPADQSKLVGASQRLGNNQLGKNVVVGRRVWGVENSFRLRLGPLTYREFAEWMPGQRRLHELGQFVTAYVGPSFDFDVQLILKHQEVPAAQLAARDGPPSSRLGWNSWLYNHPPTVDRDDAVFVPSSDVSFDHAAAACI